MLQSRKNYRFNCLGISLEQLLISLLIISLINIAVFKFYSIIIKKFYIIRSQLSILYKQNVASFLLRSNIIQSGYKGFASNFLLPENTSMSKAYKISPKAPIAVCRASISNLNCHPFVNHKILKKIITQEIKLNTDILLVYDIPVKIEKSLINMLEYNSPVTINQKSIENFEIGDHMIISDFQYIQRFIISGIMQNKLLHVSPYNGNHNLFKKFNKNAEVIKVKHLAFYIGKNQGYKRDVYSLYMDDFSSTSTHALAILDDVENLSVKIPSTEVPVELLDAANFGWLHNEKYIIINLLFKNKHIENSKKNLFSIGVEIRN